jgi:hypothetical protein
MEKLIYSEAEMEVIRLSMRDIITTSNIPEEDYTDENGGIVLPDDEW